MKLKKIEIIKYRNFENIQIDFQKGDFPNIFSIASKNGGGKSTLLQFIFTLLHCFMNKRKKIFIQNILSEFSDINQNIELVKFIIEEDGKDYNLNFSISNAENKEMNLNLYLDLEDTKNKINKYQKNMNEYRKILDLNNELKVVNRLTPVISKNLMSLRRYLRSKKDEELFFKAESTGNIEVYKKLIDSITSQNSISENTLSDLESIYEIVKNDVNRLENVLTKRKTLYITHLKNNKNVVLLESNMSKDMLKKLSNKIFLTAPNSQIFLFLSKDEKHNIFSEFSNSEHHYFEESYNDSVKNAKNELNGFFTYDFASTKLILKSFQKASQKDLKTKRKTGEYGTKYDELTNELKDFLDGKEISENENGNRVIFKSKMNKNELSPEDLSHGELKKLGIYIWLKYIVESNSIILMDEVDIALHPKWQYELIKDLSRWSTNGQFLLATHSPQIISSTYYKNIIKLENGVVKRYLQPPLDRDINSIITQVMEAPDFPEDLLELHKKYRKLISDKKIDSEEAKNLKEKILEYESESSSFFQGINFDLELM